MSRFAQNRRVFYVEEPLFEENIKPHLRLNVCQKTGIHISTPVLPSDLSVEAVTKQQKRLLREFIAEKNISDHVLWYYTPMAREFASSLRPTLTVYDCMDELSCFAGAPPAMRLNELALFQEADLVFTGGATLFESKRRQHPAVYLFPSSVDTAHFASAKTIRDQPADQSTIPYPRLGYAGVIDERMDLPLLARVAAERPDWHLILLGPVAKVNPAALPKATNIHYLGMKRYDDLPAYFSGWQIGMLPFALNESTRFISPTKTPEYLAAGLPVISTAIRDVVTPYGDLGLAKIARNADEFIAIAGSLIGNAPNSEFNARVSNFLAQSSWDKTWAGMNKLMAAFLERASYGVGQVQAEGLNSKGGVRV